MESGKGRWRESGKSVDNRLENKTENKTESKTDNRLERGWKGVNGLTTVTFRSKTPAEILKLCAESGIQGIEWGGDVHVPPGDISLAERLGKETRDMGGIVTSYGSYCRLGEKNGKQDFHAAADTAKALGAPLIRIWAGRTGSEQCSSKERTAMTEELKELCGIAAARGLAVGLEYHRGTLTDTKESTLKLLEDAGCSNLYTYWQYNPDVTHEEHLEELRLLRPYLCAVHVFHWKPDNIRCALKDGEREWEQYMELLADFHGPFLLEFVKDDCEEQFMADFAVLKSWRKG